MNDELLQETLAAKVERRKALRALPLEERLEIVEKLRDFAHAMRAARRGCNSPLQDSRGKETEQTLTRHPL